ncbi:MAG: hypothetical protein HY826_14680 [Actinobacteria bacterium]|nr:hypothetical protein [Actinomycetota bacterium]
MLSWSSTQSGTPADLAAIAVGEGDAGLPHGAELVRFTEALAGWDEAALAAARAALVAAAGEEFMIDAAAVAANFEMMTRVADGTGARFPEASAAHRAELDARLDIGSFTSAR